MLARRIAVLALAASLLALAAPAAAGASRTQFTLFEAPRDVFDPAQREQTLDEIRGFGVHWLRVTLYWKNVAPDPGKRTAPPGFESADPGRESDPAAYDWSRYDAVVDAARARGMKILLTVSGPVPRWATASGHDQVTDPSAARFGRFMVAAGLHYADRVNVWSLWNEPNHPDFLRPQYRRGIPASPALYRRLFRQGEAGLRSSGEDDPILMGETAPRGNRHVVAPLAFLRGALCLTRTYRLKPGCGDLPADGYAHHAYTTKRGPAFRPPNPDDVTIGVLPRLTRALRRAGDAGAVRPRLPVYITEFGIQSLPDPRFGVSLPQQNEYRAIAELIARRNPRVRSFAQYLLTDSDPVPSPGERQYSGFESGLVAHDGGRKPAYDGFPLPLVAERHGGSVTLWGLVRPAEESTLVELERRDRDGEGWRSLTDVDTDRRGAWTSRTRYRAARRYRVVWVRPDGTRLATPPVRVYGPGGAPAT